MKGRHIEPLGRDTSLLIVDADGNFGKVLSSELDSRGFKARVSVDFDDSLATVTHTPPAYAIIDLQIGDGMGLDVLETIKLARPSSRVIVLSSYGEFTHVVAAIRAGAMDYLTKPSDPDTIACALRAVCGEMPPPPEVAPDPEEVMWDHIFRTYTHCDENVTDTANRLKMHRRTLQRMLKRHNVPRPPCRVARSE